MLRGLAAQATAIMEASPEASIVRNDWRNRVKKIVADYDQTNARWTSVSRSDIADTTRRAFDGLSVGQFRDRDKLLPIMLRHVEDERKRTADTLDGLQVRPPFASESIPLSQVTESTDVGWEDSLIWRWDRRRAITVQGVPVTYNAIFDAAISRLRPVLLAAGTTILGVIPLLGDVFWVSMAITIMFGLAVGIPLTMILIPVLYSIFFKVKTAEE